MSRVWCARQSLKEQALVPNAPTHTIEVDSLDEMWSWADDPSVLQACVTERGSALANPVEVVQLSPHELRDILIDAVLHKRKKKTPDSALARHLSDSGQRAEFMRVQQIADLVALSDEALSRAAGCKTRRRKARKQVDPHTLATIHFQTLLCHAGCNVAGKKCHCSQEVEASTSTSINAAPTAKHTAAPTAAPTIAPTAEPTLAPTAAPTIAPTAERTIAPTTDPTIAPTAGPTVAPTAKPTIVPTAKPTIAPTTEPTVASTTEPTIAATVEFRTKPAARSAVQTTIATAVTEAPTAETTAMPAIVPTAASIVEPAVEIAAPEPDAASDATPGAEDGANSYASQGISAVAVLAVGYPIMAAFIFCCPRKRVKLGRTLPEKLV